MPSIESQADETRAARHDSAGRTPDWAGLHPVSIIAQGPSSQPVQRMMGAQSAVYRLIVMLERIRLPAKRPSLRGFLVSPFARPGRNQVPMR